MRPSLSRRQLLGHAALAPLATQLLNVPANAQTAEKLKLGPAQPFSFEGLIDHARALASQPYVPPPRPDPEVVAQIDYDAYGKIRFKPEYALYADGPSVYPITFMLVGMYFPKTVRMYEVGDGQAREILYSPDYFSMPADHVARKLAPEPSAFAGFWVRESRLEGDWAKREPWATYVGASYWRAVGELGQVGMSSRGVAIGTGDPKPEEFPDFVAHWFEPAATENDPVIVHSLLDGPSISGAYRFALHRGKGVTIDVENHLFLRADVEHLGIAPLTSMFWFARVRQALSRGLAARGARRRRPGAVDRLGRAHLATAQRSAAHHHLELPRRQSEGLRPLAARPQLRALSRWRGLRQAALGVDRAGGRLGQGLGAARRDPDRRRDLRQHQRLLGAGRAGQGGRRLRLQAIVSTGSTRSRSSRRIWHGASRPASAGAARPASPGPRGSRSSSSSSPAAICPSSTRIRSRRP